MFSCRKQIQLTKKKPILAIFERIWWENRQNKLKNAINRRELHGGEMYKDRSKIWPPQILVPLVLLSEIVLELKKSCLKIQNFGFFSQFHLTEKKFSHKKFYFTPFFYQNPDFLMINTGLNHLNVIKRSIFENKIGFTRFWKSEILPFLNR